MVRWSLKTPVSYGVARGPASSTSRDVRSESDVVLGSKR
jgi:hypothetical protein